MQAMAVIIKDLDVPDRIIFRGTIDAIYGLAEVRRKFRN